jgi:hypothetical protein
VKTGRLLRLIVAAGRFTFFYVALPLKVARTRRFYIVGCAARHVS